MLITLSATKVGVPTKNPRTNKLDSSMLKSKNQVTLFVNYSYNRPYAIDVITQITKRETDGGRKFGYYAAILSGKNGRDLRSLSTAEHFASSRLTSAGSNFTFTPRMHNISTGLNAH